MQLTKYAQSCVRLDDGEQTLVVDPGVFGDNAAALDGADAVLVTHEHPDHLEPDAVRAALAGNSRLQLWAPESVAGQFAEFGEQVRAVGPDESFTAAGLPVRTFGGQHALIHPTIPVVDNVGYLIGDGLCHPGDSLVVPTEAVSTLLVPVHAPWSKTAEVIDYLVAVRAPRAIGIHDVLLSEAGLGFVDNHLTRVGGQFGVEYTSRRPGDTITV